MAKKSADSTTATFQRLEQEAYEAFLEWPLFLVRRIKQLEQHLAAAEQDKKA